MVRCEMVMYDKAKKKEIEVYKDVYSIDEMIEVMKNANKYCFLIDAINNLYAYSDETMKRLKHEFLHCFLHDRKIMMIEE